MINEFVYYKSDPSSNLNFGNWTDKYYEYMKKSNGQLFIKSYISKLFENILLHEKQNSIKYTNDYFNLN